jgi:hypothetical protein
MHEVRAVQDTAFLELSDYGIPSRPLWVVASVTPDKGSGSATVPGAHIDARTGQFVNPSGGAGVLVKKGQWHASATSDPSVARTGTYSWTEPLDPKTRMVTPEDVYSPFAYGGTIVFRPEPQAEGRQQFGACRMIFPEWQDAAAAALRAGPDLVGVLTTAADEPPNAELVKLMTGVSRIADKPRDRCGARARPVRQGRGAQGIGVRLSGFGCVRRRSAELEGSDRHLDRSYERSRSLAGHRLWGVRPDPLCDSRPRCRHRRAGRPGNHSQAGCQTQDSSARAFALVGHLQEEWTHVTL